jgi:hypothetical protein
VITLTCRWTSAGPNRPRPTPTVTNPGFTHRRRRQTHPEPQARRPVCASCTAQKENGPHATASQRSRCSLPADLPPACDTTWRRDDGAHVVAG